MTLIWIFANWKWLLGAAATGVLAVLLSFTTIDRNQWRAAARKGDATIAKFTDAQKAAQKAAQAAHDAQEQRYKDLANAADTNHAAALADAGSATDSYARNHSVQQCPASRATGPATLAPARVDPGVPASVPASPLVVISNDDLHACTDAYVYAVEAHEWAAGLNQ